LLADILNDAAITLDALSPLLDSVYIPFDVPWSFPGSASGLRIVALCLSGSLRALCGVAAGGSKSALTLHFATPEKGVGDLGEINAKDASKETVLSLFGMLVSFASSTCFILTTSIAASAWKPSGPAFDHSAINVHSPFSASCRSSSCELHGCTRRRLALAKQATSGDSLDAVQG
jgi:hypothetical protein